MPLQVQGFRVLPAFGGTFCPHNVFTTSTTHTYTRKVFFGITTQTPQNINIHTQINVHTTCTTQSRWTRDVQQGTKHLRHTKLTHNRQNGKT